MSHELRTPLNAILGWLQLLRLRNEVPEHLREALAVVERNARAQGRLIEDLLDASRIVTGHESLALRPVAFAEPLAAAVETVKPSAFAKNVSLDLRHDITSDEVMADAERLVGLLHGLRAKVNLIPFNAFPGAPYRSSPRRRIDEFRAHLQRHGVSATIRESRGEDIQAACGQLAGARSAA